jgi:DNA-binding MarR family transcriptional regulator
MSKPSDAREAAEELVAAIKRFQDAVDLFDATAAQVLAINPTDLRCLTALRDRGAMRASEVAVQLGLTRGATTTALDRLETLHYLARRPNNEDGRGVIVELTGEGKKCVDLTWATMRKKGSEHLRSYSIAELRLLRHFFDRSVELQTVCTSMLERRAREGILDQRAVGTASTRRRSRGAKRA